jgi:hypothetical protein
MMIARNNCARIDWLPVLVSVQECMVIPNEVISPVLTLGLFLKIRVILPFRFSSCKISRLRYA